MFSISHKLARSFLKKWWALLFTVFFWLFYALHRSTLPPWFPEILQHYFYACELDDMCRNISRHPSLKHMLIAVSLYLQSAKFLQIGFKVEARPIFFSPTMQAQSCTCFRTLSSLHFFRMECCSSVWPPSCLMIAYFSSSHSFCTLAATSCKK